MFVTLLIVFAAGLAIGAALTALTVARRDRTDRLNGRDRRTL